MISEVWHWLYFQTFEFIFSSDFFLFRHEPIIIATTSTTRNNPNPCCCSKQFLPPSCCKKKKKTRPFELRFSVLEIRTREKPPPKNHYKKGANVTHQTRKKTLRERVSSHGEGRIWKTSKNIQNNEHKHSHAYRLMMTWSYSWIRTIS